MEPQVISGAALWTSFNVQDVQSLAQPHRGQRDESLSSFEAALHALPPTSHQPLPGLRALGGLDECLISPSEAECSTSAYGAGLWEG